LPSSARTAFVWGPEGHLTKTIGNLWARTLFFSFDHCIIMTGTCPLSNFRRIPSSHLSGFTVGLPAIAQLAQVFAEPLRQFYRDQRLRAVNRDSSIYRDYPIWQLCLDQKAFIRQPGFFHLDSFVWTPELSAICRDFTSGPKALVHLPGLCKNSCQRRPQTATKLNRRAVRFKGYPTNRDFQRSKARVWLTPNTCFFST
jgi:hypothetical protein